MRTGSRTSSRARPAAPASPCGSPTARSTASCSSIPSCTPAKPTWTAACSFENSTLRDFLTLFSINRLSLGCAPDAEGAAAQSRCGLKRFQQANPVGKAQKNVAHHYDLGNDFYKLFLDEGMQYSCAYFLDDNESLEQAQQNKLRLIAAKLKLKPGLEDPRHRQRLGRHGALSRPARERRRDRRHAVEGAARALEREGAAARALPIACASACRTIARCPSASTASSRSACSST